MKQLLTIAALIIMLLLQYSRQMAYLQCKIANITATQHCDCETILADSGDDHNNENLPPQKIQTPDEWFVKAESIKYSTETTLTLIKPTAFIQHFHPQLFRQKLIMPPRA